MFCFKGDTIDSIFPLRRFDTDKNKMDYIRYVQDELGLLKLLIIDEISMVGSDKLGKVDQILRLAKDCPELIMGGCHIILSGDFFQLPPVLSKSLYKKPQVLDNANTKYGYQVYQSVNCFVELVQNFRFKSPEMVSLNNRIRTGTFKEGDEKQFKNIHASFKSFMMSRAFETLPKETLYVTPTKEVRNSINMQCLATIVTETNPQMYIWAKHHRSVRKRSTKKDANLDEGILYVTSDELKRAETLDVEIRKRLLSDRSKEDRHMTLEPVLHLAIGARVMLTSNLDPRLGLFNGSVGTVLQIYYLQRDEIDSRTHKFAQGSFNPYCQNYKKAAELDIQLPIVLVKFDKCFYSQTSPSFLKEENCIIPITPVTQCFSLSNMKNILRTQLPLKLAFATTVHKIQALSLEYEVFVLEKLFIKGLAYVGTSRATTNEGLHIVESENCKFTASLINQGDFSEIHDEYKRLWQTLRNESRRIAQAYMPSSQFQICSDFGEKLHRPHIEYYPKKTKSRRDNLRSDSRLQNDQSYNSNAKLVVQNSSSTSRPKMQTLKTNAKESNSKRKLNENNDLKQQKDKIPIISNTSLYSSSQSYKLVGLTWINNSCAIDSIITQILMAYTLNLNDSQRNQFNLEFTRPLAHRINSIGNIFKDLYLWILNTNITLNSDRIPPNLNSDILNMIFLNPIIVRGRYTGVNTVFSSCFIDNRNFAAASKNEKTTFAFELKYKLQGSRHCTCQQRRTNLKRYNIAEINMDPFARDEYTIDDTFFFDFLKHKIENQKPCLICASHDRSSVEIISYSTLLAVQLDTSTGIAAGSQSLVTWHGQPMRRYFPNQVMFGCQRYSIISVTYGNGAHFRSLIKSNSDDNIYLYDGMNENKFTLQTFKNFPHNFYGSLAEFIIYKICEVEDRCIRHEPFQFQYENWSFSRTVLRRLHQPEIALI